MLYASVQNAYYHINSIVQMFLTARPPTPPSTGPSSTPELPAPHPLLDLVHRPATRVFGIRLPLSRDHVVILNDVHVRVDAQDELQIELTSGKPRAATATTGGRTHDDSPHREEL